MCGITGFIDFNNTSSQDTLISMVSALRHRGPDHEGHEIYQESNCLVGFGQSRLSIIDVSAAGNQPMSYNHLSVVFNGEIYNYKEIREELIKCGHGFSTNSDTEVILHAYEEWGINCVHRFIGMFAIVIYDKHAKRITIIRDRAGVKPLFYYWRDGLFLFASELKSFHKHAKFKKEINSYSLNLYFRYGHVPAPHSIFKDSYKIEPGYYLELNLSNKEIVTKKYWDVLEYYSKPSLVIEYEEGKNEVEKLLLSACKYRMVSDVPVGVFLSGGYDSTAVTALLQNGSSEKLKTFTIGFEEGNNEAPFAKEIAKYIGTDHTEYFCTSADAQEIIPDLCYYFDEPFADSSGIPTRLVSKLARNEVKVALSADGGDEIFGGYDGYRSLSRNIQTMNKIPPFVEKPVSFILNSVLEIPVGQNSFLRKKLIAIAQNLNMEKKNRVSHVYDRMQSYPENNIKELLIDYQTGQYSNILNREFIQDDISVAMAMDYRNYMQNDILVKVDRATMSASLEGREPLLDHRLIEYAAQLPISFKYDGTIRKKILKDIVHKYVPKDLMERPKTGFSLPIYSWLKGDLLSLLNDLLSEESISKSGILKRKMVKNLKAEFLNNRLQDETIIWKILQFQMWYNRWMN